MIGTLRSATLGILLAAAAILAAGGLDSFGELMILVGAATAPAVKLTGSVLIGIVERLMRTRGPADLVVRILASALELLSLLILAWIVLGVVALAIDPGLVAPALAGATGLALGCLVGAGRPSPQPRELAGGPFFRDSGVSP